MVLESLDFCEPAALTSTGILARRSSCLRRENRTISIPGLSVERVRKC